MSDLDPRYLSDAYVNKNPSWDMEDSPWKAALVTRVLRDHDVSPTSICEVGCGAGLVLAELRKAYPDAKLFGYDIAPAAARFWPQHDWAKIQFSVGDFVAANRRQYDVVLVLDVLEHVRDPLAFLPGLRGAAKHYVFHIPLDLSAQSVVREEPLLHVRRKVGHIHYFTKNLALAAIQECGFRVVDCRYSGAAFNAPRRSAKTRAAMSVRWLAQQLGRDWAVRVLGGETLVVLAEEAEHNRQGEAAEYGE